VRPNLGSLYEREGPNGKESESTMSLGDAMRQKPSQLELPIDSRGDASRNRGSGEASMATQGDERSGNDELRLMEQIVACDGLGLPRLTA
jgi:hypothetical protein